MEEGERKRNYVRIVFFLTIITNTTTHRHENTLLWQFIDTTFQRQKLQKHDEI